MPVVDDYTVLLSGSYWNGIEVTGKPVIVTYSFPMSLPSYDASIDGFTVATDESFQPFTDAEQAQADQALGEWAAASGLIFIQVAPGQGDINFQNVDLNTTTAYAGAGGIGFYPFGDWNNFSYPNFTDDLSASGDVFVNTQFLNNGTVAYGTLLHEIGHAIGLKHPTETVTSAARPPVVHDQVLASDDPTQTIMSQQEDSSSGGTAHLHTLDTDAAAFLYGPSGTGGVVTTSASGVNSVSSWNWDAISQTLTQTAAMTNDTIRGSSVNDIINGSDGNDQLFGLAGDDQIYGGNGNDSLYGGSGTDTLAGGAGDDNYYVDSATDTVIENSGEGFDAVYSTVSFTLPDNVEALHLFGSGLTGTANNQGDTLVADGTFATNLIGGTGNDWLYSGTSGADTMTGGAGDDSYVVNNPADTIIENPGGGTDAVYVSFSFTLPDNFETLTLNGSGLSGTGNNQGDSIFGDASNATILHGGTGDDYIVGGSGNDTISGGGGTDVMWGQDGADTFVFTSQDDAAVGGALTTIGDFTPGEDKIDLSAVRTTGGSDPGQPLTFIGTDAFTDQPGQVREDTSGFFPVIEGDVDGDGNPDFEIQLYGDPTLTGNDFVFESASMCFLAGTRIATPDGERAVESLAVGDMVRTLRGDARRIAWIGEGRVLATRGQRSAATPVVVLKGALGKNVPHHDLRVTKAHGLYIDGVLIPVEFLVNHRSILWDDRAQEVALYHIELETHDVILANGAPAESFRDDGNRWLFRNADSGRNLPPQELCAPLLTGGPIVDRIWRSLLEHAGPRPGIILTDDPDLHLLVDGRRCDPISHNGSTVTFHLPRRPEAVRIASRAGSPAELGVARDPRMLGVAIRRIMVFKGTRSRVLDAADASLTNGFHGFESDNAARWTDGDAELPAALFEGFHGRMDLVLQIGGSTPHPLYKEQIARAA
jgi:Ca2+-binding RTX toxin-like protein